MYNNLDANKRVYLIFCDISNFRHWVNESIKAEKFFENLDKLKSALTELCSIEYDYKSPTPTEQLSELIENEQKLIQKFLARSWVSVISEARKLKTDNGRKNKIDKYFKELAQYSKRFSNETKLMIEKAKNEVPDYNLNKTSKDEKDLFFLNLTEKSLASHNQIIENLDNSNENYSWLYSNKLLFENIIGNSIPTDVLTDIIKLLLSSFDYKKASRFIRIKYKFSTRYAIEIYVTARRMLHSRTRIIELSKIFGFYSIEVHSYPCPICKAKAGKVFKFSDAEIGKNYPPFCRHNCSNALPFNK